MVYAVNATKKGELPLSTDKRKWGKVVTTLANVTGDAEALCTALKGALGTGGHVLPGAIEVQGDQRETIGAWLVASGCVKGLRREREKPAAPAQEQEQPGASSGDGEPAAKERRKPRWDAARAAAASGGERADAPSAPSDPEYKRFVLLMKSWCALLPPAAERSSNSCPFKPHATRTQALLGPRLQGAARALRAPPARGVGRRRL